MSTLTSELCERDIGEDNIPVYYIYTGLKLDEAQVKAGRDRGEAHLGV